MDGLGVSDLDEGVVYVATKNHEQAEQAAISARSVRRLARQLPLVLFTDITHPQHEFDRVIEIESTGNPYLDKPVCLRMLPFARTLFLDNDTYVGRPLDPVFRLLDRFDLAVAHAPNRATIDAGLSPAFPEFNTGVIAVRKNDRTDALLDSWAALHAVESSPAPSHDQPSFRRAVWESEASVAVLPPEFNCRFQMAGVYNLPVTILHGRATEDAYQRILETLNRRVEGWDSQHVYNGGLLFGPHSAPRVLADLRLSAT